MISEDEDDDSINSTVSWEKSLYYYQGGSTVVMDMTLSMVSIVCNLMVITAIREKESLLSKTFNLVLVNLCLSNLANCVMVKSVSVVHHSHAVMIALSPNSNSSLPAFCLLYIVGYRVTLSVLPWTVVVLSWLSLAPTINRPVQPRTGMKTLDRGLVAFIWIMSLFYGMMCEEMVASKNKSSGECQVRQRLDNIYGLVSVSFVLIIPLVVGPLSALVLYTASRLFSKLEDRPDTSVGEAEDRRCTTCLTVIFLIIYINTIILCELSHTTQDDVFAFVLVKYILGSSHNLLTPIAILLIKSDVWQMTKKVYRAGGTTQGRKFRMTAEQIQKELGLKIP